MSHRHKITQNDIKSIFTKENIAHPQALSIVAKGLMISGILSIGIMMFGLGLGFVSPSLRFQVFGWQSDGTRARSLAQSMIRMVAANVNEPEATIVSDQALMPLTVTLTARDGVFTPSQIGAKVGQKITLTLHSDDRAYSFFFPQQQLDTAFDADADKTVTFTLDTPGEYPFASGIYAPGYENTKGVIVIQ